MRIHWMKFVKETKPEKIAGLVRKPREKRIN
jgi:hypothetical protein